MAVFSVLRDTLTSTEKRSLKDKVYSNYKKKAKGKPYTDIVILTGRELLTTKRLKEVWENATQRHKKHSKHADHLVLEDLAYSTCNIHLDVEHFHEWFEKWYKQRKK